MSSPHRITLTETMPTSGRWSVKLNRTTAGMDARGNNKFIWSGARLFIDHTTAEVYGDVTLMACRVKASRGIGDDASIRISATIQRNIKTLGAGNNGPTRNPADAFVDIYTDTVYGGRRPLTELDMTRIKELRTLWSGYEFNYVFTARTSIWLALSRAVNGMVAEPVPLGSRLTIAQDAVKPIRTMMFNDANIVRNSFRLSYQWDTIDATDGVEIEYRDSTRYKPSYVRYPSNSLRPDRIVLDGCTSGTHATQYARVYWQRRNLQRMMVEFDTELEGLLLTLGDRIGVAHSTPSWGKSGQVLDITGNTLHLDAVQNWTGPGPFFVILRRNDGSATDPITVVPSDFPFKATMLTPPPITLQIATDLEYTSYTFGTSGKMLRDFVVNSVKPSGETRVRIEAFVYKTGIYTGGMPFLGGGALLAEMKEDETPQIEYIVPEIAAPTAIYGRGGA
jgi:hypothetical protein